MGTTTRPGSGRTKGARDKGPPSAARLAANRRNPATPRVQLPMDARAALSNAKGVLGRALAEVGALHVVEIIKTGPTHELFTWGMDFAADRCGLPRRREEQIDAAEMPAMVIQFRNFTRPTGDE